MPLASNNIKRPAGGTPSVMVFHGEPGEDLAMRTFIRESANAHDGAEWYLTVATTIEVEQVRGLVLARECTSGGKIRIECNGNCEISTSDLGAGAGSTEGDLLIRVYSYSGTNPNPAIAKGSMQLAFTHTAHISNAVPQATFGQLKIEIEIKPMAMADTSFAQYWESKLTYQPYRGGITYEVQAGLGSALNRYMSNTSTGIDFTKDTVLLVTLQKVDSGANGLIARSIIQPLSWDGYIYNGTSGVV
jgi:hypothetical protein